MAVEIERKFLVIGEDWRALGEGVVYRQGYLKSGETLTVRVRVAGDAGYITIKGASQGIARAEYEYGIPLTDANEMLDTLCERPLIEKKRYRIWYEDLLWEVDEFMGANQGLIMAEVELTDANQALHIPNWIGKEVSDDRRYFNVNLAKHPYQEWGKDLG
ncbi:MAG: CYTH domain-containing protein [Elainellaceae cyanobacterium]